MEVAILFLVIIGLLLIGVPIAVSLGLVMAVSAAAQRAYRSCWRLLAELHRLGFSVIESRAAGRVVWVPGLGRQVATRYNLLLAKHMPLESRRSALLAAAPAAGNGTTRPLQQVHLFAP